MCPSSIPGSSPALLQAPVLPPFPGPPQRCIGEGGLMGYSPTADSAVHQCCRRWAAHFRPLLPARTSCWAPVCPVGTPHPRFTVRPFPTLNLNMSVPDAAASTAGVALPGSATYRMSLRGAFASVGHLGGLSSTWQFLRRHFVFLCIGLQQKWGVISGASARHPCRPCSFVYGYSLRAHD